MNALQEFLPPQIFTYVFFYSINERPQSLRGFEQPATALSITLCSLLMPTLLSYLTRPNPVLDRSNLQRGPNTSIGGSYEIEGVRPWPDFTFQKILVCFEDILKAEITEPLHQPPPISEHHRRLTDEACVTAILTQHNHVKVNCALQVTLYRLRDRGLRSMSWSWGSLSDVQDDSRLRPDWAGTENSENVPYSNRVPGDTKQSAKWNTNMNTNTPTVQEEFRKPLRQVLTYCVRLNTRYGYIITDAEAYFFRRTKSPEPASPLSTNRPQRKNIQPTQPTHGRVLSVTSVASGVTAMSLDSSDSRYTDAGNPDINETPLEV